MNNPDTFEISLYDTKYQEGIDLMMSDIQQEFDELFTSPLSKTIPELIEQGGTYWVGLFKNKVAGTIGLSRFDDHTFVIKRMFVAKECRGSKGISQLLMNTAIEQAIRLNATAIYLGTMNQFRAAQRFYEKNKFIRIPKSGLPAGMELSDLDTLFFRYDIK